MSQLPETPDVKVEESHHVEVKEEMSAEHEALLQTDHRTGLSASEVVTRLAQFGPNSLPEHKQNKLLKFLSYFTGAIAYLIILAGILSAVIEDWLNFGIIVGLLFINAFIGYIEEARAESALDALKNTLALKSKCWRDGKLHELDTSQLVPGDIIILRLGDIVPADARLLGLGATGQATEGDLLIDQSALTGESLPVSKAKNDVVYSSSVVKQGQMLAVVTKTGANTFIGRAANLIAITNEEGHFQKIVNQIGNFLILITVAMVIVIFGVLLAKRLRDDDNHDSNGRKVLDVLGSVVVLTVAAIPVGLPTVLSVTMAVGAKQLAAKQVIVKRLPAVEELASVSILCSDKTGTLTLNELTFDDPYCSGAHTPEDVLLYSYLAAEPGANDPIESAVRSAAKESLPALVELSKGQDKHHHVDLPGYHVTSFLPFNPSTKLTQATVLNTTTKDVFKVAKGAPQVIINLVGGDNAAATAVNALARRGLRALGVARTEGSLDNWVLVGMISLLDPPREDSAQTIRECSDYGVEVKMITGDQLIIAKEVAHRLGMNRVILDAHSLVDSNKSEEEITEHCIRADGFAQVIPEHKYRVVELLQNRGYLVGMTGDGVNDAPALKKANVGIAVHGCTDAARSAADIVLLAPGLNTIVDGIKTARAIFQRMRSYALYRIASTVHFLVFFFFAILCMDWEMDAIYLILITLLNDAATLVISVDNAKISQRPDKWRLGQLITLSLVLGTVLAGFSFGHFFIARDVFNVNKYELESIMYLHLSSAPHFLIFSTRLSGYFWTSQPSWTFIIVILATQVLALFFTVYGVLVPDHHAEASAGWGWGISVLAISFGILFVLDYIKVQIFRHWSFEMTAKFAPTKARRAKMKQRRVQKIEHDRVFGNWRKARRVLLLSTAIRAMKPTPV